MSSAGQVEAAATDFETLERQFTELKAKHYQLVGKCKATSEAIDTTIELTERINGENEQLKIRLRNQDALLKQRTERFGDVKRAKEDAKQFKKSLDECEHAKRLLDAQLQRFTDENRTLRGANAEFSSAVQELTSKIEMYDQKMASLIELLTNKIIGPGSIFDTGSESGSGSGGS